MTGDARQPDEPLAAEDVRAFVAALPEAGAWGEEHRQRFVRPQPADGDDTGAHIATPFTSAVEAIRAQGEAEELEAIVRRHGFTGLDHWGQVGDRLMRAYLALRIDAEQPLVRQQMQEARERVQASVNLSAERKQQMLTMMDSAVETMRMVEAPEADKAAVRPHLEALERAFRP